MAIRQEDVQINVDFITDESRAFARTLQDTKAFTQEITTAQARIKSYQAQLKSAANDEQKRAEILNKIALEEQKVAAGMASIAREAKKVEGIDLTKLTPAQLVERARQLETTLRNMSQTNPAFGQLQKELAGVNGQLKQIRDTSKGINTQPGGSGGLLGSLGAIGRFSAPLLAVGTAFEVLKKSIGGAAQLEQLTISFETFLGSADKAKKVIADLKAFEVRTPFSADQVNNAGRALLAFGFSSEQLIPILNQVGDIAAGTGKDFNELALIYGKASASGKIQGDELNQLAEAGIPIYTELAKVLGVNTEEIRKLGEQGKIDFADLQQVFTNLTATGSRFGGLMERQSQSLNGLLSTLQSAFQGLLTDLGRSLAPTVKLIVSALLPALDNLRTYLQAVLPVVGKVVAFFIQLANFGFNNFKTGFQDIIDGARALYDAVSFVFNFVVGFFGSAEAQQKASESGQRIVDTYTRIFTRIYNNALEVFRNIGGFLAGVFDPDVRAERAADNTRKRLLDEYEKQAADLRAIRAADQAAAEKAAQEQVKKDAENAAKAEAARQERQKKAEAAFQAQLKGVEVYLAQQELLAEVSRTADEDGERLYQNRLVEIKIEGLRRGIEVYRQFRREESIEAIRLQRELLQTEALTVREVVPPVAALPQRQPDQVEQDNTAVALERIAVSEDAKLALLKSKLDQALLTEQEYNLQRLEVQRLTLDQELAALRNATVVQVEEVRIREQEKANIENQIREQRIENDLRTQQFKKETEAELISTTAQGIGAIAELLAADEAGRKKHAETIKAFQIGEVTISGITEIQKIFAGYAELPFIGQALAIAQAAIAALRTATAIKKISSTKFEKGGYIQAFGQAAKGGVFGGQLHSSGGTKGVFSDGTRVEVERGEAFVVVNRKNTPLLRTLSEVNARNGNGVPFMERGGVLRFNTGGLTTLNTTPNSAGLQQAPATVDLTGVQAFADAVQRFNTVVEAMPAEVKARIVYTELEDVGAELEGIRGDAAL